MVECPCGLHRPERLPIRRLGGPGVLVPRPDRQRGPGQAAELAAGAEGPLQPRNRLSGESWLSGRDPGDAAMGLPATIDRKSTRLNSSHLGISYAVFCLKKKENKMLPGTDTYFPPRSDDHTSALPQP